MAATTKSGKNRQTRKPSLAARRRKFLAVLKEGANVSRALRAAGLASSTAYSHRNRFEGFRRDWDEALSAALDELESALMERALKGVEKPVFYRGEQVSMVRTYSDAAAMFMLRARRPEVYDRGREGSGGPARPPADEDAVAALFERRLTEAEAERALPAPGDDERA